MFTYSSDISEAVAFGPQASFGNFSNAFTLSCNPLETVDLAVDFELLFSILLFTEGLELHLLLNLK